MFSSNRVNVVLAVLLTFGVVALSAQSKDPFVGTWTLNVAKSKYNPGPPPKSQMTTYEAAGKGFKVTVKTVPASGPPQEWSYTTNRDGVNVPITGNNANADMIAVKQVRGSRFLSSKLV
jgi:hypothetical protein